MSQQVPTRKSVQRPLRSVFTTMLAAAALVITSLIAAPAANAATAPNPGATPNVSTSTIDGRSVVSLSGVTINSVGGATIATSEGQTVVVLSAAETKSLNALTGAFDASRRVFDAQKAVAHGASQQDIADAAAVLGAAGWTIHGQVKANASLMAVAAASSCRGFNGYHGYYFPWGSQYGLNSCNTSKLIADVSLGAAGAGAVAAVLAATGVGAVTAGIIAAVLAFGAAALAACQAYSSNGAIWLNLGGIPTVSCWGQ